MLTHRLPLAYLIALTLSAVGCHYDYGHGHHHELHHHPHADAHSYNEYEYGATIVDDNRAYSDDTAIREESTGTESSLPALLPPPAPAPARSPSAFLAPPTQGVFESPVESFDNENNIENDDAFTPSSHEIDTESYDEFPSSTERTNPLRPVAAGVKRVAQSVKGWFKRSNKNASYDVSVTLQ
jgi:hypothetical protein